MLPTSLIVGAIVVAWLVVLVPMIVRKRQAIARTADSALTARVVRSGSARDAAGEEVAMRDIDTGSEHEPAEDLDEGTETREGLDTDGQDDNRDHMGSDDLDGRPPADRDDCDGEARRRYRPGRGGFDPDAAALAARAKYAFRQRVVLAMLLLAVGTGVAAGLLMPVIWFAHGAVDLSLVCYLAYLRRQVRIEEEVRERRLARMAQARRVNRAASRGEIGPDNRGANHGPAGAPPTRPRSPRPGAVVVEIDDEDPAFDELDEPGSLPYRRAVGE